MSLITPESMRLIDRYLLGERVQKATGGVLGGPDSSLWPARWLDAVATIAAQIEMADAAFHQALRDYRPNG